MDDSSTHLRLSGSSRRVRAALGAAGVLLLAPAASAPAREQAGAPQPTAASREKTVTARARGTFEVKLTPQPADDYADGAALGRMVIDKQFQGDLQATSKGQMLTGMSSVKGSAGYVAIERVSGALAGRRGTFVLQHSGIMARGAASLTVTVVPESGTDQLTGLTGTMTIDVAGGQHSYEFEYTLPAAP
jgi:hypothetical protein